MTIFRNSNSVSISSGTRQSGQAVKWYWVTRFFSSPWNADTFWITYLHVHTFNPLFISAGLVWLETIKTMSTTCRHSKQTHSRFTFLVQKRNKDGHFTFSTTSLLTVYCSNTSCISGLTRKGPKRMSSFSGQYWRHFIYQMWSKNFRLIYGLESEIHVSLLESMFYYSEIYSISFLK